MTCPANYSTKFAFPPGPALTDFPVSHLYVPWVFLPKGATFTLGEVIRIWMENGQTREVAVEELRPLHFDKGRVYAGDELMDEDWLWQVAQDNGYALEDLRFWPDHPLRIVGVTPVLMRVHPIYSNDLPEPGILPMLKRLLIKIRSL